VNLLLGKIIIGQMTVEEIAVGEKIKGENTT